MNTIKHKKIYKSIKLFSYLAIACLISHVSFLVPFAAAQSPTPTPTLSLSISLSPTPSPTGNPVRDKVREVIENLSKKPKAALGILNEVSQGSLKIETKNGSTELLSIDGNSTYFKATGASQKEIKFDELELGLFTLAMGYKDGSVFQAKRIITYDKPPQETKEPIFGKITKITKSSITVQNQKTSETKTIDITKQTKLSQRGENAMQIKFADIKEQDTLVGVVQNQGENKNPLTLRLHKL